MDLFNIRTRWIPKESTENGRGVIYALGGLSIAFYLLLRFLPFPDAEITRTQMLRASQMMSDALGIVRECRRDRGLSIEKDTDLNHTGLIGREFSPVTTSRGDLQAKRTTTNPNMAALVVQLLNEASLGEGDLVAVGASGSFPALIIATLAAAKAMRLLPLPIYSIGASQWGANEPEFTWLRIETCLGEAGWLDVEPLAVSLGGENDIAENWSQEARSSLESGIATRGDFLLYEPDLERNVVARMNLYEERAGASPIRAFVNIGGAWANLGESAQILELEPGLNEIEEVPAKERRGVIFEMAARQIPVIHLLHIRGLSDRYGLPWDPAPMPAPGKGDIYHLMRYQEPSFLVLSAVYLFLVFIVAFRARPSLSRPAADH
jgi:poly-gamma-glutamate system protein